MKKPLAFLSLFIVLAGASLTGAAVLPPEQLLPKDTIAVLTAPDTGKFLSLVTNSAWGKFWRAPEMQPFRDKFDDKFKAAVGDSMEKDLGLKVTDLASLAQGQTTFAVLPGAQADRPEDRFIPILLVDAKDHVGDLKRTIADVKKKWADAGKPMKTDKILDYDFTTFTTITAAKTNEPSDSDNSDGAAAPAPPGPKKSTVVLGQVDSLLILSSSSSAIEKILSRKEGGLTPALAEQPDFQTDFNARLRQAPAYAWVNARAFSDLFLKGNPDDPVAPGGFSLPTILNATGLSDITSACLTVQGDVDGMTYQLNVAVPETHRHGLIKAFAIETKDASPPSFVPADASEFWRWRVNLRQTWSTLEDMLNDINPNAANLVNFVLSSAGKDKDDKYDLKAELLGNLGDDVISYAKSPAGKSLADFKSPPSVMLIGSPNPDHLAAAIKVGLGALAQTTGGVKEQDFLGRKIYSIDIPAQKGDPSPFSFAASASYVAFSSQHEMVEEFLRSDEGKSKPLSETEGLQAAAAKIGGEGTGFLKYDNMAQSLKAAFDVAQAQGFTLNDFFGAPSNPATPNISPAEQLAKMKEWADFSLLPPYDAVSKYFYFQVETIRFTPDGFSWALSAPTPPKLR